MSSRGIVPAIHLVSPPSVANVVNTSVPAKKAPAKPAGSLRYAVLVPEIDFEHARITPDCQWHSLGQLPSVTHDNHRVAEFHDQVHIVLNEQKSAPHFL